MRVYTIHPAAADKREGVCGDPKGPVCRALTNSPYELRLRTPPTNFPY